MWRAALGYNWRSRRGSPSICVDMLQHAQGTSCTTVSYPCRLCALLIILTPQNSPASRIDHTANNPELFFLFLGIHCSSRHTSGRARWGASSCTQSARILGLNSRRYGARHVLLLWIETREVQRYWIRFLRCLLPWMYVLIALLS
jgi:hypothetical protein